MIAYYLSSSMCRFVFSFYWNKPLIQLGRMNKYTQFACVSPSLTLCVCNVYWCGLKSTLVRLHAQQRKNKQKKKILRKHNQNYQFVPKTSWYYEIKNDLHCLPLKHVYEHFLCVQLRETETMIMKISYIVAPSVETNITEMWRIVSCRE